MQLGNLLRLASGSGLILLMASCASQRPIVANRAASAPQRVCSVRTTAYTHTEAGGGRNAVGQRLCSDHVISAAADWSRWPLGTKFRIVDTNEVFEVDDYGGALVGTGTIDLYKTNRLAMRQWGVRSVDIDVLEWGSAEKSLKVLKPRSGNAKVHEMVVALAKSRDQNERKTADLYTAGF